MNIRVCFVGDDVRPPWNHASSILTKRLIECLSPSVDCTLATVSPEATGNQGPSGIERMLVTGTSGSQSLDALRLSLLVRGEPADIFHLVGTNALVFSPVSKFLRTRGRIVRHIFTPYDSKDRAVRPVRWVANKLFIDRYAFTTPRMGRWAGELSETKRFLLRPPINCDLYRPFEGAKKTLGPMNAHKHTVLYMGPLMPSRFPHLIVLRALKGLTTKGVDVGLVVLTSATRTTAEQCEKVLEFSRDLAVEENFVLKRVDLSEQERILWYNSADVVVFPYAGPEPEKLADPPFGILESMACGCLVLATDVLSVSEIVEEGVTGFLLSNLTPNEVESGLLRALETSERRRIQTNARNRIMEKFDYSRVREDALEAYLSIID